MTIRLPSWSSIQSHTCVGSTNCLNTNLASVAWPEYRAKSPEFRQFYVSWSVHSTKSLVFGWGPCPDYQTNKISVFGSLLYLGCLSNPKLKAPISCTLQHVSMFNLFCKTLLGTHKKLYVEGLMMYSGDLKSRHVRILNGQSLSGFQMVHLV